MDERFGAGEFKPFKRPVLVRLAHFFGTSAEFWLNLQSLYELRLAQQKAGKSIKDLPTLKRSKSYRKVTFAITSRSISRLAPVRKGQVA